MQLVLQPAQYMKKICSSQVCIHLVYATDDLSDRKSSETRMAEQRPRKVSRSGLAAVSDPRPMLPRRSVGHLHGTTATLPSARVAESATLATCDDTASTRAPRTYTFRPARKLT